MNSHIYDLLGKYDDAGYDREGYDIWGYDREGYDKKGFNRFGYDRKGFNWKELRTNNIDYMSKK